jgi:hypothetical protein
MSRWFLSALVVVTIGAFFMGCGGSSGGGGGVPATGNGVFGTSTFDTATFQ